jgi:hypothetical protein
MTPARAAEVLRDLADDMSSRTKEQDEACLMGAEALKFQTWLFALLPNFNGYRVGRLYKDWNGEDSFIDYCRGEWEKERKGKV